MKIVYIHQYFKTIYEAGSTRSYFICQELIRDGHEVVMITARKEGQTEPVVHKKVDGIDVYYIANFYNNKLEVEDRVKSFIRFMFKSIPILWKQKNVDLVIATSTPLTVGVPALLYKWLKKVPFVFEVRDLWPEVPIQMGGLKNPVVKNSMLSLEKSIYRNALHVVALSPGMKDGVVKVLGEDGKVSMIPNMAKKDVFYPRAVNEQLRAEMGLKADTFKMVHFGAMGIANNLDYILEAARILKERGEQNMEFIFLGEGRVTDQLKSYAQEHGISNIHFFGRLPMVTASEIVNLCDVSLVTFRNIPILATNSPNKFFDSLSAAKPIVVNSNGWTKDIVESYRCGTYADPERPEELATLLQEWQYRKEELVEMGKRGREVAEKVYDESVLCRQFADVIKKLPLKTSK